jgi:hypothetical protein
MQASLCAAAAGPAFPCLKDGHCAGGLQVLQHSPPGDASQYVAIVLCRQPGHALTVLGSSRYTTLGSPIRLIATDRRRFMPPL